MDRKKRNAATIAIAMCVAFERSGLVEGKIPDASVQTIRTKTTNQLQLTPNSIPAIRPRRKLLPIRSVFHEPPSMVWRRGGGLKSRTSGQGLAIQSKACRPTA